MSGSHTPPPQFQTGGMSGTHPLPPQQHSQPQHEEYHSPSRTAVTAQLSSLRESVPGLGGGIDASTSTANLQPQPPSNNGNNDVDKASKMHPPGARQQHQQQQPDRQQSQHTDGSPHLPDGASPFPVQPGKRAVHSSSSGPPPKKRTTQPEVGGGHSVKRVGTDTLSPPHKRRSTGQGPQSS